MTLALKTTNKHGLASAGDIKILGDILIPVGCQAPTSRI